MDHHINCCRINDITPTICKNSCVRRNSILRSPNSPTGEAITDVSPALLVSFNQTTAIHNIQYSCMGSDVW
jgi:hypothetical protein